MKTATPLSLVVAALFLAAPLVAAPGTLFTTVSITGGLSSPIGVTNAGDGTGRLFIVERCGKIRIFQGSALLATPFIDLGTTGVDRIVCGGERGLLGLAFHPSYETNGRFFVYYTRKSDGDLVIARYQVSTNPNVASTAESILMTIEHSTFGNHNGGHLAFGPDGYLYIATGDGGDGGDPFESGQSLNTRLGKLLRVDVDQNVTTAPFHGIPADNPFVGTIPGLDDIWHYGLRNPWHFSFDRQTGDLFIGDVGQGVWEEIDFRAAGSPGGVNFGWDCREGPSSYNDQNDTVNQPPILNSDCPGRTFVEPILSYDHGLGCSVTGGSVFRNLSSHSMFGNYFFGDFCTGRIWRGVPSGTGGWSRVEVQDTSFGISGFGEGENGRIYFTDLNGSALRWLAPHTFSDVLPTNALWRFVEAIHDAGISDGCGSTTYCPNNLITRGEMAVFLLLAAEGAGYTPPACTTPAFADVPCSNSLAPWINELAARGITGGCGGGNFCPGSPVTRDQMAVFLLAAREGTGYTPPACTTPRFTDVPCSSGLAPWVNELAARGVTAGCGGTSYCPAGTVTRGQMAVFLATTFNLPLP